MLNRDLLLTPFILSYLILCRSDHLCKLCLC